MANHSLCPMCFAGGFTGQCARCGYIMEQPDPSVLRCYTVLHNRYMIGAPIGVGGFGITYAALDTQTGTRKAIKEFYPGGIAQRKDVTGCIYINSGYSQAYSHSLERFTDEARVLHSFSGVRSIVRVDDFFPENNTAYIVMEFLTGKTLKKDYLQTPGMYPFERAQVIFYQVAEALSYVHRKGLLHRDISPDNIIVDEVGNAKLIDFGAARSFLNQRNLTVVMKKGYAPIEQYSSNGNQGEYTDIYALGCTLYTILSGQKIPDAPSRIEGNDIVPLQQIRPDIPQNFAHAINKSIAVYPKDRFQHISDFVAAARSGPVIESPRKPAAGSTVPAAIYPQRSGICNIRILSGPLKGNGIEFLADREFIVGRTNSGGTLQIPLASVSKQHLHIIYNSTKKRFVIWDGNSTNGTFFYNGQRLIPMCKYAVSSGDRLYLANEECLIEVNAI